MCDPSAPTIVNGAMGVGPRIARPLPLSVHHSEVPLRAFLGVDIGTSSSKGVVVDERGRVLATAVRRHEPHRPRPGHVEMDGELWWTEFVEIASELVTTTGAEIAAIGVSGMGPCVLIADDEGRPVRSAILYGVDARATDQIASMACRFDATELLQRCGSLLTTQAVGPKLMWLAQNEPDITRLGRRLFMPASWIVYRLTGEYVLDRHSASQCTPLFDTTELEWIPEWSSEIAPWLQLPRLAWPSEVIGVTRQDIAGIPAGVPVVAGTIDAWTEALSVGAHRPGDLMLMYGTTMFLIASATHPVSTPSMWGTVGVYPGTWNLAGGLATSGAITDWIARLCGSDYAELTREAESSLAGANGLLMLPYFAGERTPIMDPDARGLLLGLTVEHTRGDLYRAALESTAMAVRHNVQALRDAGIEITRVAAAGGGTQSELWMQIVSDVTGLTQEMREVTIGASFGAAYLAARALDPQTDIDVWNPVARQVRPEGSLAEFFDGRYRLYRETYEATAGAMHALAAEQRAVHPTRSGGNHG